MPQKSKRKCQATLAAGRRWTTETFARSDEDSDEKIRMNFSKLIDNDQSKFSLKDKINIGDIADLFEIVKSQTSLRSLSVLIYLSLTHFGVSWRKADLFLKQIGSLSAETCNKWSKVFIEQDLDDFLEDNRGGKRGQSFYDTFPELKNAAKLHALEGCKRKSASLTAMELAEYLDKQYYELTGEVKKAIFPLFGLESLVSLDCPSFD